MQSIDKNASLKAMSNKEIKQIKKAWITEGILTSISKTNYFLKKIVKFNDKLSNIRYKCYSSDILKHFANNNK